MPTINMLPSVDSVVSGDQLPVYSQGNGDARKASINVLMQYIQANLGTLSNINVTGQVAAGYLSRGAPVTKTSSFAVGNTENWIICNGGATITVTLPNAADWVGREIMFKNLSAANTVVSGSSNVVPLGTVTAGTAILPASAGSWVTLVSDGANWIAMQGS